MRKLLVLTAAVLIAQATPVLADGHKGEGHGKGKKGQMFEKYDTNGDSVISQAEYMAKAQAKFSEKDTNGDGSISKEEAKAAHKAKREKMKEKRGSKREAREQSYNN